MQTDLVIMRRWKTTEVVKDFKFQGVPVKGDSLIWDDSLRGKWRTFEVVGRCWVSKPDVNVVEIWVVEDKPKKKKRK